MPQPLHFWSLLGRLVTHMRVAEADRGYWISRADDWYGERVTFGDKRQLAKYARCHGYRARIMDRRLSLRKSK